MSRVTHKHIEKAVQALNARRGLSYPSHGYLQYADVTGSGIYRGRTMRETLDKVNSAS